MFFNSVFELAEMTTAEKILISTLIQSQTSTAADFQPPIYAIALFATEMATGRVDRHRLGRPASRVTGRLEILRPVGQAGWKTGLTDLSCK